MLRLLTPDLTLTYSLQISPMLACVMDSSDDDYEGWKLKEILVAGHSKPLVLPLRSVGLSI